MSLKLILNNNRKTVRKLVALWIPLSNPKNYVIPDTIEVFQQLGGIFASKIKINSTECFFNSKSKVILTDFLNAIISIKEIKNRVSYHFIYNTTISLIESAIHNKLKRLKETTAEEYVNKILVTVINIKTKYKYFRIVDGIEIKGIESLKLGDVELFTFSEKHLTMLKIHYKSKVTSDHYNKSVEPFIKKYLLNNICISVTTNGDLKKAEEIAKIKFDEVISILRFIVCIYGYEKIYENLVKINLLSESYNISENNIMINVRGKGIMLNWGSGRKNLIKLPINPKIIADLKKFCSFNLLVNIFKNKNKSELEKTILTSIYWIGEAQNDYKIESSFIKYWISLETLISISKDNIQESLAKGISIMIAFGGYKFVEIDDVNKLYVSIKKLYDKRSKIVHSGVYENISPLELSETCKYAVWCVLTSLGLRSRGYTTLRQIKYDIDRLHSLANPT